MESAYLTTLWSDVRRAYDEYQARKKRVADQVKAEVERRIREEEGDLLRELSKTVHEAHKNGLSKARLREATRKYGNATEFSRIWDAYTPPVETELSAGPRPPYRYEGGVWYLVRTPEGYLDEEIPLKYVAKTQTIWPDSDRMGKDHREVFKILDELFESSNGVVEMSKYLTEALRRNDEWADFVQTFETM